MSEDLFSIIQLGLLLFTPLLLLNLAKRFPLLRKIGVITLCYILGIIAANTPGINLNEDLSKDLLSLVVPLFIPLLLFNSDPRIWPQLGKALLGSFLASLLGVLLSAALTHLLFRAVLEDSWILSSMMVGVYTGGTPNLSAIGMSLNVDANRFVVLNATDLIFGGLWLLFLLSLSKRIFKKILKPSIIQTNETEEDTLPEQFHPQAFTALGFSLLILLSALGLSWLLFEGIKETFILLVISTFATAASLNYKVRSLKGSFAMGNYLLMIFCLAIGSIAQMAKIWDSGLIMIAFVACAMFGAIFFHLLLAYLFKIDVDTFIVTSTAGIFGPAFIAPVAKSIGKPQLIAGGIAISLLGYGVANYLGLFAAYIFRYFL